MRTRAAVEVGAARSRSSHSPRLSRLLHIDLTLGHPPAHLPTLCLAAFILLHGLFNAVSVRLLGLLSLLSVVFHVVGTLVIVIGLPIIAVSHQSASWVFGHFEVRFSGGGMQPVACAVGCAQCRSGEACCRKACNTAAHAMPGNSLSAPVGLIPRPSRNRTLATTPTTWATPPPASPAPSIPSCWACSCPSGQWCVGDASICCCCGGRRWPGLSLMQAKLPGLGCNSGPRGASQLGPLMAA